MKTDSVQYVPVMQYIPKAVKANATDIAQSFPRHQVESEGFGRSHTKNTSKPTHSLLFQSTYRVGAVEGFKFG